MRLRPTDGLTVRPLFYDALSGEFAPPTDGQKRAHTLGRLAFASYQKGDYLEDSSPNLTVVQYIPSWAEHVTVRTRWLTNDFGAILSRISLTDGRESDLAVWDEIEDDQVAIYTSSGARHVALALGEDLDLARTAVTSSAQAFFDSSQ